MNIYKNPLEQVDYYYNFHCHHLELNLENGDRQLAEYHARYEIANW